MVSRVRAGNAVGHREDVYDFLKSSIQDMIGTTG